MQYLLTENEYIELVRAADESKNTMRKSEQELCTNIANTMPIDWGWGDGNPKPWRCILTAENEWYCDSCPVQDICPYEDKLWSK